MIVAAAIKTKDGRIHVAARHPLCFAVVARHLGLAYDRSDSWSHDAKRRWFAYKEGWEQGFVDSDGVFYTRETALAHVEEIGQFMTPCRAEHPGVVLTSEDLW